MRQAILLGEEAYEAGEVPIGCVLVDQEGNVVGSGRNRTNETHNVISLICLF